VTALRRAAAPLAGVAVAVMLLLASRGLGDVAPPGQLSPAFWPRLVLVGLALACLVKGLQDVRAGAAREVLGPPPLARGRLTVAIAAVGLYVLATPWLGFPLANALFIAGFLILCGARGPVVVGLNAVVGTVALLYVFVKLVYLPLPKGAGPFEDLTIGLLRALRIF